MKFESTSYHHSFEWEKLCSQRAELSDCIETNIYARVRCKTQGHRKIKNQGSKTGTRQISNKEDMI